MPALVSSFLGSLHDRLRRAMKIGVTIAAGSDNHIDLGMPQGEAAKHNLFAYAQGGVAPAQLLQFATWNASRLLGLEGKIGVLRARARSPLSCG